MTDYSKMDTTVRPIWFRIWYVWVILGLLMFTMFSCQAAHASVNMEAIKQIESGGNPYAFNKSSGARGLYQITPICLKHYNEYRGTNRPLKLLFNPLFNTKV